MTGFRSVTPDFAVAGQITLEDVARAAAAGFKTLIDNRPDGEDPGQPKEGEIRAAAEAAGIRFHFIPFSRAPSPNAVAETATLLDEAPGPVLAYCRSGRRSIMAWAMAQALSGVRRPDELIELAFEAGYDLEGARGALETLAPKS